MLVQTTSSARWENLLTAAQRWRGRRGAEMERARCKHPTFSQTAGVGWRDPETKNCVFVFSGSFPFVLALVLCLLSVLSSFICPSFHLPLFLVLCFRFVRPFFSIACFLPFFLLSFSYNICTQRSKGVTGWWWRHRDLKMGTQIYGQTEFKETRSVPEGQRQQQQKKPWKCYFSSFTSDSWNVSLTERQTASQQIRRQRARSVLNAVTCPKSVSPPGCYDLTMLWVYVRVEMEHCCNRILPLKKAVTLLY